MPADHPSSQVLLATPTPSPDSLGTTTPPTAGRSRWWLLAVVALAQLMIALDTTIMNIALPSAQAALGFATSDGQWVVTGCALAFGSLLPLSGHLADRFGRRTVLVTGLLGFAVSSGIGGAASSLADLVAARVGQGIFAALLAPAVLALLSETFREGPERAQAFGVFGAVSMAGTTIGLLLGGVLTEYLTWRATMYVNVLIAVPAAVGALAVVARSTSARRVPIDVPGATAVTAGLFALVLGSSAAATNRWTSATVLVPLGPGLGLLAGFVLLQRRARDPLLPLHVVLHRVRGGALIGLPWPPSAPSASSCS